MKYSRVCKGNQLLSDEVVESTRLDIDDTIPKFEFPNYEQVAKEFYNDQAKKVLEALSHLPQGTKHQLLILLLQEKVNIYQGP